MKKRRTEVRGPMTAVFRLQTSVLPSSPVATLCKPSSVIRLRGINHVGFIPELEYLIFKVAIAKSFQEPLKFAQNIVPIGLS